MTKREEKLKEWDRKYKKLCMCCDGCRNAYLFWARCNAGVPEEKWGRKCGQRKEKATYPRNPDALGFSGPYWDIDVHGSSPGAGGRSDPWA